MLNAHKSVLLNELIDSFKDRQLHYFVDATLGAGGHSEAILRNHPEIKMLIGIDQDPLARTIAQNRLNPWESIVKIMPGNFSQLDSFLKQLKIDSVNGIIFDLGVSSMQLDIPEKGFSFMREGPLDMRMDPTNEITAELIINSSSEKDLGRIFRDYGEEKYWRKIAHAIVKEREQSPIKTTLQLAQLISKVITWNKKGLNPSTLVFQALRIAVNSELSVLEMVLPQAINYLKPGGLIAVISFHSLEDRIVKNTLRFAASDKVNTSGIGGVFLDKEPQIKILNRKPIVASENEIKENTRSRSAKLRIAEKK